MKVSLLILAGLFPAALASGPIPLPKHRYTITVLPPASGADFFQPRRINNRGDVLGHLDASMGEFKDDPHAALYHKGVTIDLHLLVPGGETNRNSLPVGLNDRGEAIFHAENLYFIYRRGRLEDCPQLTAPYYFEPAALNNAGQMVGTVYLANQSPQAVLYSHGAFHLLGSLPGLESEALAINNHGQIVGRSGDHAVLFGRNGSVDLGELSTYAIAINDRGDILGNASVWFKNEPEAALSFSPEGLNKRGQIVGSTSPYSLSSHAMLHVDGVTHDLNDLINPALGWTLIYAYDVNDHGQIVGWGRVDGHWSGFLLTPSHHAKLE
jgi:probable HAF family extracellular repeat protein